MLSIQFNLINALIVIIFCCFFFVIYSTVLTKKYSISNISGITVSFLFYIYHNILAIMSLIIRCILYSFNFVYICQTQNLVF